MVIAWERDFGRQLAGEENHFVFQTEWEDEFMFS